MVNLKFWKGKDDTKEFLQDLAMADASGAARTSGPITEDYVASLGRSVYMIMCPETTNILASHPHLANMMPAFSHVNRTVKLDRRGKDLADIRFEILLIKNKLTMDPEMYEEFGMELLDSLRIFAHNIANDGYEGWKGHLVTEQIRKIITEQTKEKGRF